MNASITLKKHEDKRVLGGHLWVFSNEIASVDGAPQAGDIVLLRAHGGRPIGRGFYHPNSLIAFRLLSQADQEIDFAFFQDRIGRALELRERLFPGAKAFRLVHGESDLLPGLVIDKYHHYLTVQTFSAGMDKRLTLLCDVLDSLLKPKGIVERNESGTRELEGLEPRKAVVRGNVGPATFEEHGLTYTVDLLEGQKTGFFLDQRENRFALRRYCSGGARVLDCFSNDGGFALNAAAGGADAVVAVDSSAGATERVMANAAQNKLRGVTAQTADAFDWLKAAGARGERFDVINLDPPSFAKNRKSVPTAKIGYRELHDLALALLNPGGYLATASCSHHIDEETYLEIVQRAARAAGRTAQLLEWRGASPDHPVLPAMPETRYLKFGVFRIA